jgi:hypothetical protein
MKVEVSSLSLCICNGIPKLITTQRVGNYSKRNSLYLFIISNLKWSIFTSLDEALTVRIYLRNIEIQNVDVSRRIHQIDCCSWLIRLLLNLICKLLSRHVLQITFKRIPNYADAFLNTSYSGIGCQKWTSKTPPPPPQEKREKRTTKNNQNKAAIYRFCIVA